MANNRFLLDTHFFIWAMEESPQLSSSIKKILIDPNNKIFISVASIWEIAIKKAAKKIKLAFDIEDSIQRARFEVVPINISHAIETEKLPNHHKDPFDRILITQAKIEKMTLMSKDPNIKKYQVKIIP